VLNHNQNLLGKCFLAMRRHVEELHNITEDEWLELRWKITAATNALALAFAPDHFNYAFLQNQDRHVHLHVIPRYASARTFAGRQFEAPDYPDHYAVPTPTIICHPSRLRRWPTNSAGGWRMQDRPNRLRPDSQYPARRQCRRAASEVGHGAAGSVE